MTGRNFNVGPSSLPKYIQISEFLAREIAAGRLISGTRLAPERQMAKDFKTSVITLRKALKRLEVLGVLNGRSVFLGFGGVWDCSGVGHPLSLSLEIYIYIYRERERD